MPKNVIIIGAGLSGCLLAVYLARRGEQVRVYERRPDPRAKGYVGGRSINLALSARGLRGLAGVGLDALVLDRDAIAMPGRMLHDTAGATRFQPYSKNPAEAINSVSRGGLNLTLLKQAASHPNVKLVFDHACEDVDLDAPAAILKSPAGVVTRVAADVIIGADGAFSPVRTRLQKTDRFEYSQSYLDHGYKELCIPPAARTPGEDVPGVDVARRARWIETERALGATFAMDPHALHIWPRGGSMMIALPNRDASFTCTLFWPMRGEHSFERLSPGGDGVGEFFREHYPDAAGLMTTLLEDYAQNPVGSLVTVRCAPWQYGGKVAILGDAAHAVVPFYGQGMNCAFEDVRALAELLDAHKGDYAAAFPAMEAARKANADAIADMAIENFLEMRDLAGRSEFQYRKRIERVLHEAMGEAMTPQYNLVSFSNVPYAQARARGRRIESIVRRVASEIPARLLDALGEKHWTQHVIEAGRRADAIEPGSQSGVATGAGGGGGMSVGAIDITPAITPAIGVWPGDTTFSREVLCDLAKGDTITLSTIRTTTHLGAHADGPNHYGLDAPGIGERSLARYLGPCHVVEACIARGGRVTPRDVIGGIERVVHPRVLIRTGSFPDPDAWNSDFAALSVELIDALSARGVMTIGIDTPSVDVQDSKDLPAHKAILGHDIAILEGLVLADVSPGEYELIALPLKMPGVDASPVRAALRPLARS